MARISRKKKIIRVVKRKLLKPVLYAIGMSLIIYMAVGNMVLRKRTFDDVPHFVITRVSDTFDQTEFMHLLLTIQEVNLIPKAHDELFEFVNSKYNGTCPSFLEKQLYRMNWTPEAFYVRVQKLFALYDVYDRIMRYESTITFLEAELKAERLPVAVSSQIELLKQEADAIIGRDISMAEYQFIKEYGGMVLRLKKI